MAEAQCVKTLSYQGCLFLQQKLSYSDWYMHTFHVLRIFQLKK